MDEGAAPSWAWALGGALSAALSLGSLWAGFGRLRLWRRVADTPTQRVRSAAMGVAELKGLATPKDGALAAPFTGTPCCWWRVTVEEERTVRTEDGTRKEWRQIHEARSAAPFSLDDLGARVDIDPAGAEIEAPRLLEHVNGGLWAALSGGAKALAGPGAAQWAGGGFSSRRRLREWRIDVQRPLYCLGVLRQLPGTAQPSLGLGRNGEPCLISTASEAELLKRLRWAWAGWVLLAALLAGLGAWLLARSLQV